MILVSVAIVAVVAMVVFLVVDVVVVVVVVVVITLDVCPESIGQLCGIPSSIPRFI